MSNLQSGNGSSGHRKHFSFGTFFSDAYFNLVMIDQLANWIIDQIFEIELLLGRGNGSDWHETRRNEVFRPKFVKMGPGKPIFGRKWNRNGIFFGCNANGK